MSARNSGVSGTVWRPRTSSGIWARSAPKPECISALTQRARARALGASGQMEVASDASRRLFGRDAGVRRALVQKLGDRDRFPNHEPVDVQHRHAVRRAHGSELRHAFLGVQWYHHLRARETALANEQRAAHLTPL